MAIAERPNPPQAPAAGPSPIPPFNQRIGLLYLALILGFVGLAGRVFYLQVIRNEEFKKRAAVQQKKIISIAGKRGIITDIHGHKLAIDVPAYAVYVDPEYLKDHPADVAAKLAPLLKEPQDKLTKNISGKFWHYIKRKLDEPTIKQIKALKIPGIGVLSENKRIYPHNEMAASLIGYTDIDNIGQEGIEKSFNEFLQGGATKAGILTDAYGNELLRIDGDLPFLTEKAKANKVVLTIDENIQYLAERELKKGMESTQAERGVAIVMGIPNGDLLALATSPSVNLNTIPGKGWDPRIKNWAVTDFYEPGSTMKVFTLAASLEAGKTSMDEVIHVPTLIYVDNWPVHDHHQPPGRVRSLKPLQILEVSSNVGSSMLGRRMKPQQHRDLLLKFGFGTKTHSGLNGEVGGLLPELPWAASRQSTISFGQGVAVTPLQVVTAASAIANKGVRVEPRIIHEIISPENEVIKQFPPMKTRTLSEKTANEMLSMMSQVVESQGGTAHNAKIPGYQLGGKTGTADKVVNGRYNGDVMASFIGVLPADNPRYVIFVLFDAPRTAHYASMTAVPVYREICKNLITYFGLQPSRPQELKH
ncbi:MAG: penicillin-binding protein 2 [Candidatus Sericytochromatia bacterium]|nr:penicillin-binding protein 2 [Candidatus Sericytochromatia bacterium]